MKITRYLPLTWPLTLLLTLLLVGCTMEFINAKPARELKPPPPLEGDLYAGWRVFQSKCASCHSSAATGGDRAPDLLPLAMTSAMGWAKHPPTNQLSIPALTIYCASKSRRLKCLHGKVSQR